MPRTLDTKQASDWMRAPSRREPWVYDNRHLIRPMTDEEHEEMLRLTCGRAVLLDLAGEA